MKASTQYSLAAALVICGLGLAAADLLHQTPKKTAAERERDQHRAETRQLAEAQATKAQADYDARRTAAEAEERAKNEIEDALIANAKSYVRAHLKSPATAAFQPSGANELTPGIWKVFGSVDSQNSFGALLRSPWSVVVRQKDLHVYYLRIGEEKSGNYSEALAAAGVPASVAATGAAN